MCLSFSNTKWVGFQNELKLLFTDVYKRMKILNERERNAFIIDNVEISFDGYSHNDNDEKHFKEYA